MHISTFDLGLETTDHGVYCTVLYSGRLSIFLCLVFCATTEAEFLDEIQIKVLRLFLLAIYSHLYRLALRFLFLQTHETSTIQLRYTVKEKGGKPDRTLTFSLWFKILQKPQV